MIDTIIITIPDNVFKITDYSRFKTTQEELERIIGFKNFENNPTLEEKGKHYYPNLTLTSRTGSVEIKIQFSAPKMYYNGDNVREIDENHLERILDTLYERLKEMGVLIRHKNSLAFARVTKLDVSKNFILSGGYTANYVIRELSKIDLHGKLDLKDFTFKNNGHALHCHAATYEIVFYDKYAETFLPKTRRIDPEAKIQQDIFKSIPEILRMEVRLSGKKLNPLLGQLGYPQKPTLKDVFNKKMCQDILKYYWRTIVTDKSKFIFNPIKEPQKFYALIKQNHPEITHKKAMQLVGLYSILNDPQGIRGFKTLTEKHNSGKTWSRTKKEDMEEIKRVLPDDHGIGFLHDIERQLDEFKPIELST